MLLRDLLPDVPNARIEGDDRTLISSLTDDSRRVVPGALYVAVPSLRDPGSTTRNVAQAIERGAAAVVADQSLTAPVPVIRVDDARRVLGPLASAFYGHPSHDLALFAVTGTDGKTTTTYLLEQVLASCGFTTGLVGTVETHIAGESRYNASRMTTPGAVEIQNLLREMVDRGVTHATIEASSHGLALNRLRGCRFAATALTNFTADHIEFHGSVDAYFAAKASLFRNNDCPSVLNRDDPSYERFREVAAGPVLSYGFHPDAELRAVGVRPAADGQIVDVRYRGERAEMPVPLPGRYNVSNALAAGGLALLSGVPLDRVAAGLGTASGPPGRFQRVQAEPFAVVVDYAHTVNAFRSVLSALRQQTPRRLIAVFGAAGGRDRAKRPDLARIAREYADFFVITNEDPCEEDPVAIIAEIAGGVPEADRGRRFECREDRGEAIALALGRAHPGDTVVILGKGHEQTIDAGESKLPWSDVETARRILERAL